GLLFGLFPSMVDKSIIQPVMFALDRNSVIPQLKIWHGLNTVLMLSALTILSGIFLFFVLKPSAKRLAGIVQFNGVSPQGVFDQLTKGAKAFARHFTKFMHDGFLRSYLTKIIFFLVCLIGYYLIRNVDIQLFTEKSTAISVYEGVVFFLMIV